MAGIVPVRHSSAALPLVIISEDIMKTHPYLRAYMAGTFVPTLGLLLILTVFIVVRLVFQVPFPLERAIVFPMALVPNIFGVWNILYLWSGRRLPIGLHGALLPLIMAPLGVLVAKCLGIFSVSPEGVYWFEQVTIPYAQLVPAAIAQFCGALVVYYLVWKYIVGSLNRVLEIA
jgi:hypothetical protein